MASIHLDNAHSRRKFIEAIKVQTKAHAADAKSERVVALMDGLFAIDRVFSASLRSRKIVVFLCYFATVVSGSEVSSSQFLSS